MNCLMAMSGDFIIGGWFAAELSFGFDGASGFFAGVCGAFAPLFSNSSPISSDSESGFFTELLYFSLNPINFQMNIKLSIILTNN